MTADRLDEPIGAERFPLTGTRELRRRTPLFNLSLALALASFVAAILGRRPELLALGAPFLGAVALALGSWRAVGGEVRVGIDAPHLVEGDRFRLLVDVEAGPHRLDRVEIELVVSDRLESDTPLRAVTSVDAGATVRLAFPVTAASWGLASIESVRVRVTDRLAMFGGCVDRHASTVIRIGLPEDRLQTSLEADRFRRVVGSHLSDDRGDGLEIADIRPWLPGDSMRAINWRISNRRREPWVTQRHPDRSTTVVVLVDAHDGNSAARTATQRRSVAAAMALARGHLSNHDPVGLLIVGHTVRWLPPRLGRNHLHRIADELISVSNAPEASLRLYRPPAVQNISRETIVVAVSPLHDPLMVSLLAELRSRGNGVAVLVPDVGEPVTRRPGLERPTTGMARRLAAVEQAVGAQSLQRRGIVLVPWGAEEPVTAVIEAVRRLRQAMRRSVA